MKQTKEEIKLFWDNFIRKSKTSKVMLSQNFSKIIIKNAYEMFKRNVLENLRNRVNVLEVGCGTGVFTEYLAKEKIIKKLLCTDISGEAIKICKKRDFNALIADAENLPFKNKSFDIVCGFEILHHLNNPKKAIEEACRVSRKIVFFNETNKWNPIRQFMERFYYEKAAHETSYSILQYKKWFKNKNFSLGIIPYNFLIPYFSNDLFIKLNVFLDDILIRTPLKFIGSSLAIIAKSEKNKLFKH
jgi:ubiquinone/menaquinone biosynthesis C-methylase UbiE